MNSYLKLLLVIIIEFCAIKASGQEAYVVLSSNGTTLTFRYDEHRPSTNSYPITPGSSPWRINNAYTVNRIVFDSSFADARPTSTAGWFSSLYQVTTIQGLEYLNTSEVTDMRSMFYGCQEITSLDLSGFDTSKVTDMSSMFSGCISLRSINISNFNTSNVLDMHKMFNSCNSLNTINAGSFYTSKVTNMNSMFSDCDALTNLDIHNFDTSNVTDMGEMFHDCNHLKILDLSHFNTSNVTNMDRMFCYCRALESLDLSSFCTSNVTNMKQMFNHCEALTSIDLSHFDTHNVVNMNNMFSFSYGLKSLDLRSFDISNVGDTDYMIVCGNLKELYISPTMEDIHNNACAFMGNIKVHITIYAPEGFDFGTDTTGDYFVWKRGYFTLGTTVSLNISTAGIRTYSNYYSLDYSNIDNLKAYIISDHDPSTGELILTNVNEVPAGEGVLLIGEEGSYDVPIKPTDAKYTNLLIGCPFAKTISPTEPDYVNYILANGIHGINFYTLSGSGEIGANKAYLHLQKKGTSEAKSFLFFEIPYDEEDNGISIASSVRNVADKERGHIKDSIIYDLQGRRVSQLGKGIYIRDGKTIVIQ